MAPHPELARLLQTTRAAMAVQVLAMVVAVLLASPSYVDRLSRPTICTGCYDFRGLDFILWALFLAGPALVLLAATWLLRPNRILSAVLPLIVDLVLLGFAGYALLGAIGKPTDAVDAPAFAVQVLQVLLVLIPAVITLVLALLVLDLAHRPSDRRVKLARHVLIAQVVAMVGCVALSSPSLSDRLSSTNASRYEGVGFASWTLFLAPAGLVLVAAAWRLGRQRRWSALATFLVDILLLGVLGLSWKAGILGPPGSQLDPSPYPFGWVQVLLVVIPAVISLVLGLALLNDKRRRSAPRVDSQRARDER